MDMKVIALLWLGKKAVVDTTFLEIKTGISRPLILLFSSTIPKAAKLENHSVPTDRSHLEVSSRTKHYNKNRLNSSQKTIADPRQVTTKNKLVTYFWSICQAVELGKPVSSFMKSMDLFC